MEVTHTPGQGGGPRGRLSSSHGLRPEPTRRGSTPTDPEPQEQELAPSWPRLSSLIPRHPTSTRDALPEATRRTRRSNTADSARRASQRPASRTLEVVPCCWQRGGPIGVARHTKISPIGGRSSGTASEARWAETHKSPSQRSNRDHWRSPRITGQTGRIGLITRRSRGPIPRPGSPLPAIGRPAVVLRARPPAQHTPLRRGACCRHHATFHGP